MKIYDSKGKTVTAGRPVGRGGEAVVYRIKEKANSLAKIYEPAPRYNYLEKLTWMVQDPPENPTQGLAHPSFAWPTDLLFDSQGRLVGYLMPYIQTAVPILEVFNPRLRSARIPGFDRRYLHRTARNLTAAVGSLHKNHTIIGDLNESNILVTPAALVSLIDTDSFQVEEKRNGSRVIYPCPVAKLEYTAPELHQREVGIANRGPEHDAFALGVLIFQLLMEGNHPFRAQWLGKGDPPPIEKRIALGYFPYSASATALVRPPQNAPDLYQIHPALIEMVMRCFLDGHGNPERRPGPTSWEQALIRAEKALITCARGHVYSNHLQDCPFCNPSQGYTAGTHAATTHHKPSPPAHSRNIYSRPREVPVAAIRWNQKPAAPRRTYHPQRRPFWGNTIPLQKMAKRKNLGNLSIPLGGMNQRSVLIQWAKPKVFRSLAAGGGWGACAGIVPGAAVGAAGWAPEEMAAWTLMCGIGGIAAGILRGWKPGYHFGRWVEKNLGWQRVLPAVGLFGGALGGGIIGFLIGWWAILPVFMGLFLGARLGFMSGRVLWQAGNRLGWERIWAVFGALGAAFTGWVITAGFSGSGIGQMAEHLAGDFALVAAGETASQAMIYAVMGGLGGGLGGVVAGTVSDLAARFSGLLD